ncbi:programmed cell death protein 2-like [Asterias amurensis]|uniref:programmed cell death protein 2-like n=1 Tax=Asterias amurensis TaxID=7602 RepID=UPI003AB5DF82
MAAPTESIKVTLGFVEKVEKCRLSRKYFPSKVGGKPAWLSIKDIPNSDRLKCPKCGKVCIFLIQVYCPVVTLERCFHRTLFIFVCKAPSCHSQDTAAFVVLRSQLPRANEFYDYEPPDEDNPVDEAEGLVVGLCAVCGCHAGNKCSKCQVRYCSREHQKVDWKAGHKASCGVKGSTGNGDNNILFPEFELVTEPEDYDQLDEEENGTTEHQETKETTEVDDELDVEELEKMAMAESQDDRQFAKFKKRIQHEPDQVIRYERGGQPLLISREKRPQKSQIPPCGNCGSVRQFEFQVTPQLLIHLGVDSLENSIDWGTLIVYTCTKSCDEGAPYKPEFLWKQDIVDTSM